MISVFPSSYCIQTKAWVDLNLTDHILVPENLTCGIEIQKWIPASQTLLHVSNQHKNAQTLKPMPPEGCGLVAASFPCDMILTRLFGGPPAPFAPLLFLWLPYSGHKQQALVRTKLGAHVHHGRNGQHYLWISPSRAIITIQHHLWALLWYWNMTAGSLAEISGGKAVGQ